MHAHERALVLALSKLSPHACKDAHARIHTMPSPTLVPAPTPMPVHTPVPTPTLVPTPLITDPAERQALGALDGAPQHRAGPGQDAGSARLCGGPCALEGALRVAAFLLLLARVRRAWQRSCSSLVCVCMCVCVRVSCRPPLHLGKSH